MKLVSRPPAAGGPAGTATIYDVARAAGVSPATVSRVLNGSARVVPATRARVEAAIRQLDFYPNDLAPGRARRGTGMVGIVVPDITNPLWAEVALGAEETLRSSGYGVILTNTGDSPDRQEEAIAMLRRKRADGLLVAALRHAGPSLRRARAAGIPVVLLSRGADDGTFDLVTVDARRAAFLATEHLLQLGHRRIGLLGGPPDEQTTAVRREGYLDALAGYGIGSREATAWIAEGPGWGLAAGRRRMSELLGRNAGITAIVAVTDVMAMGAWQVLAEAGLRVPLDVSLVSLEDIELAGAVPPGLTTAGQPPADRGRIAAEILLERLRTRLPGGLHDATLAGSGPRRVVLQPRLVRRGSTAPRLEHIAAGIATAGAHAPDRSGAPSRQIAKEHARAT